MHSKILGEIDAVAFDIDGTLYRESKLNIRIIPHFLSHIIFFSKYGLARKELRRQDYYPDFNKAQAELMGKYLKCSPEEAQKKLDKIVYTGLKHYFTKFKACRNALELIKRLKEAGVKIAVLSDFPPEQKGDIWGIKKDCDLLLSSELIGALKPSSKPFEELSEKLEVPVERILYIGNSHAYDVAGPKKLGMKAGWFVPWIRGMFGARSKIADITFWDYRQLDKFIFNKTSD